MTGALTALRGVVSQATAAPGRSHVADLREGLLDEIGRLLVEQRKVVVVIVGATGTGKSTLFNGLARQPLSPTGLRRPTTSHPIVWYTGAEPPSLEQVSVAVRGDDSLLEAVILVDAPDFDSSVDGHRQVVERLLARADLCVFIASAKRYADRAAWAILALARRRATPIYLVLNRLPKTGASAILDDYVDHLSQAGLLTTARSPRLLLIPEQQLNAEALPHDAVAPLRRYLESLCRDDVRRDLLASARAGRLELVAADAETLADSIDGEAALLHSLEEAARASFGVAAGELNGALETGPAPEELEATMVGMGRSAMAATLMAWATAGVDVPSQSDLSELEEKAKKAVAEWQGSRPQDRQPADLEAVFTEEAARLSELAHSWSPPTGLSEELRRLAVEITSHA